MQNTINFIKYHAVEFIKFLGTITGILLLIGFSSLAGAKAYAYLIPIFGNWTYLGGFLLGMLCIYGMIHSHFPGINKQIEP